MKRNYRKNKESKIKNIILENIMENARSYLILLVIFFIGIILGVLIIKYVVGAIDQLTPVYSKEWIIAAFTISVSIGVIFGLFPANKAASLNPIEALRNE